jgi:hypothetical protein
MTNHSDDMTTNSNGDREWYVNGVRHRTDGPAVEWADGDREWWLNGAPHRTDGPAVEWADGTREWYVNGVLHRIDGPAVEWANGGREYWIQGVELSETLASFIENGLISLDDYAHAPHAHAQ